MRLRLLPLFSALLLVAGCGDGGTATDSAAGGAPGAGATTAVSATQAPAGQDWTETVSETSEGFVIGNPDAPIKLVEYGSRTCPTCGAFGREAYQPLLANYVAPGKVSFEFRDFLVHGAPDLAAAMIGRCGGPGPFFPILEQMYADQPKVLDILESTPQSFQAALVNRPPGEINTAWAERLGYIDFAKQRGIPEAKARACLTDQAAIESSVGVTNSAMRDGKVSGTPTFFLNGKPIDGAVSWEQVEAALKGAGA